VSEEDDMAKKRGEKMTRPPRVNNVPKEDDEQTELEIELGSSGRGHAFPREGLVGAHVERRERAARVADAEAGQEGREPTGPGSDVAPTKRAEERERERHRLERELGRTPAAEEGLIHERRAPGVSREDLDRAAREADRRVASRDLPQRPDEPPRRSSSTRAATKRKPLAEQVVVVMGASTGIGRLTALSFAKAGARVVIAGRGRQSLDELVAEIRQLGGKALGVVADTSDFEQVKAVAEAAERELGGLDTWVQAAAVSVYAPLEATTPEEFRRVVDVNLNGQAFGALAAIPVMKRQGGGAFISVSSIEAEIPLPYHASYAASKHGVNGMLEVLRMELRHSKTPISVTAIMPASIDTPFFDHSLTRLGVAPRAMPPLYEPERVAKAILRAAVHPRRRIIVGTSGHLMVRMHRWFPRFTQALLGPAAFRAERTRQPKAEDAPNNLTQPLDGDTRVRGREAGGARARDDRRRRRRRWGAAAASLVGLSAVAVWGARWAARA
jgi:NAD(P)-dependent dehydrogenase (short-subunit alcohol dehydrogenase family)